MGFACSPKLNSDTAACSYTSRRQSVMIFVSRSACASIFRRDIFGFLCLEAVSIAGRFDKHCVPELVHGSKHTCEIVLQPDRLC